MFVENRGPKAATHKTGIKAASNFSIKTSRVSNRGSSTWRPATVKYRNGDLREV
jgi:hypothetical protein